MVERDEVKGAAVVRLVGKEEEEREMEQNGIGGAGGRRRLISRDFCR